MNKQIVENFVAARHARAAVPAEPTPADLAEAYEISAGVRIALGEQVGGWKVGHMPDGGAPMGAPMYVSGFVANHSQFPMKPGRPMIPEIEIAARLSRDIPARLNKAYTRDELLDYIDELVLGVELIERRIPKGAAFLLNLADDLGNIGYVVGPTVKDFRHLDLTRLHCKFVAGDVVKCDRVGGHPKGDPLVPLVDWANGQRDRHGGMKAGQIITFGSLTPPFDVVAPAQLRAEVEGFGEIAVRLA